MERLLLPVFACLTLGLAPFVPEPHIVGKLRWVLGGAVGMGPMDWFDLVFHGVPWLWLGATASAHLSGARRHRTSLAAPLVALAFAILGAATCVGWALLRP